jgi:RNA polymerase sigma factor (sigma-70 family)
MNDLFESHREWAEGIASAYVRRRCLCSRFSREQVQQAALIGLWNAAKRFDPTRGSTFQAFAYMKIVGAIGDEYRHAENFWNNARSFPNCPAQLILGDGDGREDIRFAAPTEWAGDDRTFELINLLRNPMHQTIVYLRYVEGLTQREAGLAIGKTEVRACQLENEALVILRNRIAAGERSRIA